MGVGKVAGGGLGLIGVIITLLFGGNVLGGDGGGGFDVDTGPQFPGMPSATGQQRPGMDGAPDPDKDLKDFMGFVVDNVQASWEQEFQRAGQTYQRTTLVLFEEAVSTGCGQASSATGPFYCPADRKMYLDFGFFRELSTRFGAPGDFAQAYVIAHEVGHHVQNLLGVHDQVQREEQRRPKDANELSVRVELQADCFAGVWGHSAYQQQILEDGDLEEGLAAAASVGDDRLQREATGRVSPESFTHGTSAQRTKWFKRGFDSGDPDSCDTFNGSI
jgi:predicted metalloprotease